MRAAPTGIEDLINLSRQAGEAILAIYDTDFSVQKKADNSPLTEADMAAHHIIVNELASLTPDIPVLSEESAAIPFEIRQSWNRYWLIDPLDGTKQFVMRNGEFTVNIALIDNHEPVLGVIYVPVTGLTYYGQKEQGAFKLTPDKKAEQIYVKQERRQPLLIASSRSHASDRLLSYLDKLGDHKVTRMGSSLKSCLVAEGRADLYPRLGPTSEWDTAAAQAIVEAAGGQITDTNMQPLRYNTKASLLNPHFFVFGDSSIKWSNYLVADQAL